MTVVSGPTLFARFAYPPNSLGYCGPDQDRTLLEYAAARATNPDLRALAHGFEGAWPYLELIATANHLSDLLDRRVVEAYWLGNELAAQIPMSALAASLESRFRGPAGRDWSRLAETIPFVPSVQHGFHVFAIYPWVGLLRGIDSGEPLRILDRCRIRWGRVEAVLDDRALVSAQPLHWDGRFLTLAPPRLESPFIARHGYVLPGPVAEGDMVAMHWEWVCQRLTSRQLGFLRATTGAHLRLVNQQLETSPAGALLG